MTTTMSPLSFGEVLRITVMRRIWYAQVVSLLGDFLAIFAVISVVSFRLHGTPAQVTGVQVAYMLPLALLGPISGVFVDRWPLKQTLIASDLLRAGLVLLLFAATSLWQVYMVLVGLSAVSSFFAPAQSVTIRHTVPPHGLLSANALMQMGMMSVRIIGPATAGVLVSTFGPDVCYAIDAASFLVSASLIASVAILRPPTTAGQEERAAGIRGVIADMGVGIRFIASHPTVSFVAAAMAAGLFTIGCFGPLIAIFVRELLHGTERLFGAASAMIGVGLLIGTSSVRAFGRRTSNETLILGGLAGIGVGVLALGAVLHAAVTLGAMLVVGFAFAFVMVPAQTLMQQTTPHALLGRVSSTMISIVGFANLLGLVVSGMFAQFVGVRVVFLGCAVVAWLLALSGRQLLAARDTPVTA
jgi:MFS transporter, DHA3 family, macrolide efflux protein